MLVILAMASASLFADEDYGLNSPSFMPITALTGDPVLYHVDLVTPERALIAAPLTFPSERWIEVTDVKVGLKSKHNNKSVYSVNVMFVSFKPGLQLLPPIFLGDVTLRDIEVRTLSVLEKEEVVRLSPSRGQAVLPGTWLVIALFIVITAACAVSVFVLAALLRRFGLWLACNRKKWIPASRLKKSLAALLAPSKKIRGISQRGFEPIEIAAGISAVVRIYLAERLGVPACGMTTPEVRHKLEGIRANGKALAFACGILSEADEIRFAGGPFDSARLNAIAERAGRLSVFFDREEERVEPE